MCDCDSPRNKLFRFFRLTVHKCRGDQADGKTDAVHMCLFEFAFENEVLSMSRSMVKNTGGLNPEGMTPDKCIDSSIDTQWLDYHKQPLTMTFSGRREVDAFRFVTGVDMPERDPVEWLLEGSCCGLKWVALHLQEKPYPMTLRRQARTNWFHFLPTARFFVGLTDWKADHREAAIAGLVKYCGEVAEDKEMSREKKLMLTHGVVKYLIAKDEEVREGACVALGRLNDEASLPFLIAMARCSNSNSPSTCEAAQQAADTLQEVGSLERTGSLESSAELAEEHALALRASLVEHQLTPGTRTHNESAYELLGQLCSELDEAGQWQLGALIAKHLTSEVWRSREVACKCLGSLGQAGGPHLWAFAECLEDTNSSVARAAEEAVLGLDRDIGKKASVFAGLYRRTDPDFISYHLLPREDKKQVTAAAALNLRSTVCSTRSQSLQVIAKSGPPGGKHLPEVLQCLHDEDWSVRAAACTALGSLPWESLRYLPGLANSLRDESVLVRASSCRALGRRGLDASMSSMVPRYSAAPGPRASAAPTASRSRPPMGTAPSRSNRITARITGSKKVSGRSAGMAVTAVRELARAAVLEAVEDESLFVSVTALDTMVILGEDPGPIYQKIMAKIEEATTARSNLQPDLLGTDEII